MHQPPHIFAVLDTVVSTVLMAAVSVVALVTAPASDEELRLLLVPLIGALITSGGMIMLNPRPETRRIVIGRAVIALFAASISPQICALYFTSYAVFLSHPVVLLGAGGLLSAVFYAMSRPFCEGLYRRSAQFADIATTVAEKAMLGKMGVVVSAAVDGKIEAATVKATEIAQEKAKDVLSLAVPVAAELIKTAQAAAAETQKLER